MTEYPSLLLMSTALPNARNIKRRVQMTYLVASKAGYFGHVALIERSGRLGSFLSYIKVLAIEKPKVVHIFEPGLPVFPAIFLLLKILGTKIVYDSGDLHHINAKLRGRSKLFYYFFSLNEFLAYKLSDMIIVRGAGAIEVICMKYAVPLTKITRIPDPIELERFALAKCRQDFKRPVIGFASSLDLILSHGRTFARGWELIYVAKNLINLGVNDFTILIMGRGPGSKVLEELANALGVKEHVIFTGYVSESLYPEYINCIDIGFYESYANSGYEVMIGTKMLEYMAAGKPVIAGNVGENRYALGDTEQLVQPCDLSSDTDMERYIDEITKKVMKLIREPELRESLGNRNKNKAFEEYSPSVFERRIKNFYSKLI